MQAGFASFSGLKFNSTSYNNEVVFLSIIFQSPCWLFIIVLWFNELAKILNVNSGIPVSHYGPAIFWKELQAASELAGFLRFPPNFHRFPKTRRKTPREDGKNQAFLKNAEPFRQISQEFILCISFPEIKKLHRWIQIC